MKDETVEAKGENQEYFGENEKILSRPILFARAVFHLKNEWLALEAAGYNLTTPGSKYTMAYRLKNREDVQREIKRLQKELEKQVILSVAELDKSVIALQEADMSDFLNEQGEVMDLKTLPRSLTHAVQEYTTETRIDPKTGEKIIKRKIKLHNKKEVGELLMRRKNLLKGAGDGSEVRVRFSFGKGKGERIAAPSKTKGKG